MISLLLALITSALAAEPQLNLLRLPPGYKVEVYAKVPNARSLAQGPNGIVFVGNRNGGAVYAIKANRDVIKIADGLTMPNGVAFKDGDLYVAEVSRILRFRGIAGKLNNPGRPDVWGPSFPTERHHGWKFIAFGPDGWLYVPVGAPCNVCDDDPNLYAAIHRVSPDGRRRELVAKGVRNTVGFDWQPQTGKLWFTDNGRDMMGDDIPPCELNRLETFGTHFGFPHCHGRSVLDPEFGKGRSCSEFVQPMHEFPAHSAPLGMRFRGADEIFVAEHGSWNRTTPIGYQVTRITLKNNVKQSAEPFLTGFLQKDAAWGRPVDILFQEDGSMLVSDDLIGAVYRITKTGQNSTR